MMVKRFLRERGKRRWLSGATNIAAEARKEGIIPGWPNYSSNEESDVEFKAQLKRCLPEVMAKIIRENKEGIVQTIAHNVHKY